MDEKLFEVEIVKPEEIYRDFSKGNLIGYSLGGIDLFDPFYSIDVVGHSKDGNYKLEAFLPTTEVTMETLGIKLKKNEKILLPTIPIKELKSEFNITQSERMPNLFICERDLKQFEIFNDTLGRTIIISNGSGNTQPFKIANFKSFEKELNTLKLLLELMVEPNLQKAKATFEQPQRKGQKFKQVEENLGQRKLLIEAGNGEAPEGQIKGFINLGPIGDANLPDVIKNALPKLQTLPNKGGDFLLTEKPNVTFDDIGGYDEEKEKLKFLAKNLATLKDSKWRTEKIDAIPKGAIIVGPPGCGKTLMTKAVANEAGVTVAILNIPDFFDKFYSESARKTQEFFNILKSKAPIIGLIDEVDAIPNQKDNTIHEESRRMLNVMLTNINGLKDSDGVVLIATTNKLEDVDGRLRRSGRLGLIINLGLPKEDARKKILEINLKHDASKAIFEESLNIAEIAKKTDGLSGSDLAEIVRRALFDKAMEETLKGSASKITTEFLIEKAIEVRKTAANSEKQIGFH